MEVGDTKDLKNYLNVKQTDFDLLWNSSNLQVIEIDSNGLAKAIGGGNTVITISYIDEDGEAHSSTCNIQVTGEALVANIDIKIDSNGNNGWNTKNVILNVSATSNLAIKELKYTINCNSNCQYTTINNPGTITVSNDGTNNVKVVAVDKNGNAKEETKQVKIDKTKPTLTITANGKAYTPNIYDNTGTVKVCYTCKDNASGCQKNSDCQTYTANAKNNKISMKDNAGNESTSYTFNVIIDKTKPTCSLSIINGGTELKAVYNDEGGSGMAYYGFNNKYQGTSERTIKISNLEYTFYVKDNADNTNTCSIKLKQVVKDGKTIYEIR